MRYFSKLNDWISKLEAHFAVMLLPLLSIVVIVQILLRPFKVSQSWTTEASILLFMFIGFLGAVIADREREHVRVSMIDRYLTGKAAQVMSKIIRVFIVAFGLFITFQAYNLGLKQASSVTPALGVSASIYSLPVVIAGLLIALHGIVDLISDKV